MNQTENNAADEKTVVNMSPKSITNSDKMIPKVLYCPTAPLFGDASPCLKIKIQDREVPCLLDSGAEITVVSKSFLDELKLPATVSNTRMAHAFGGTSLTLEGPRHLMVEICEVKLVHPVYALDANTPIIVGYDLMKAAKLVIDTAYACVWSHFNRSAKSSIVLGQPESEAVPTSSRADERTTTTTRGGDGTWGSTITNTMLPEDEELPLLFPPVVVQTRSESPPLRSCLKRTSRSPPQPDSPVGCRKKVRFSHEVEEGSAERSDEIPSWLENPQKPDEPFVVVQPELPLHYQCDPESPSPMDEPSREDEDDAWMHLPPNHPLYSCGVMNDGVEISESDYDGDDVDDDDRVNPPGAPPVIRYLPRCDGDSTTDHDDLPGHLQELYLKTAEQTHLSSEVEKELKEILVEYGDVFATSNTDLGYCDVLQHDIDTGDAAPIKQSPRRPPLAAVEAEDQILDDMLRAGVIEPSNSPWASPVCLVKKRDGSYRFCVDYRRVNAVTKADAYPVPDIQDAFDNLRHAKWFLTMDLLSGYWQVKNTDRAKERSAFCTRRGLFQFTRMPFGLSNAPATFCRVMSTVLKDHLWKICLCYLDDLILFGRTEHELLERFRILLQRLREVGLKVKPTKCELFKTRVQFLGHVVSADGVEPIPEKLDAIRNWPVPHCVRDVRAFYGLASYYRKFVKGFAAIAEPLTRLTKKGTKFCWTEDAQVAFDALKNAILEAPILAFPQPGLPVYVDTDASDVAIGGVISQKIDGQERPIAFFSRIMNAAQRNYCPTRRELLAAVATLQHFRHYLLGAEITLRTDHHSLTWLRMFKRPEGILARWIETLSEFQYTIVHRPGRLHCNADGLSRPICKQCWGRVQHVPWVDELERADECTEPLSVRAFQLHSELSDSDMIAMQADDDSLVTVIGWLTSGVEPTVDDLREAMLDARSLWSQRPVVCLQSGVLVRCVDKSTIQLVVPRGLRKRLFDHVHGGPLSAHLGVQRTVEQLRQTYYWPAMKKDVEAWYRECDICAQSKVPPSRPKGQLHKIFAAAPLDLVSIDILSGLPEAKDGSKYILVAVDSFSRWAEAYSLPDAEAATCISALYTNFFSRFGLPRQLHSDQGKNFESKLFEEMCRLTGVNKTRTTPFHPRGDGQVERFNRTLLQMLRTTAHDDPQNWPLKLPIITAAYRMTVHSSTHITPNQAMLGREVLLPSTLIAKPPEEPVRLTVPYVKSFRDNLRDAHESVRRNTHAVAKTQKTYFDRLVKGPIFAVNQYVWLFWPRPVVRQKYRKLTRSWTGPFQIISFKSQVVCVVKHVRTGKRYTVHIDRLTPCYSDPHDSDDSQVERAVGTVDSDRQEASNTLVKQPIQPSALQTRDRRWSQSTLTPSFQREHQSTTEFSTYDVRGRTDGRPRRQIHRPARYDD